MNTVKRSRLGALGKIAAVVTMIGALGLSASAARASDGPPACDGEPCDQQWECGTKCVCNPHALKCFDNTTAEA